MSMDPTYKFEWSHSSKNSDHPINFVLIRAANENDTAGVIKALRYGANVNARERLTCRTALHIAASSGLEAMLRAIFPYRPSLQAQDKDGNFAINLAAEHGHLECVKLLMSEGSLPFIGNRRFKNPLMLAAEKGHFEVVEYLLNEKIRLLHQLNKMNESELTLASKNGHIETVRLLLERANPNFERQTELNEAFRVALNEGHLEVAELLIAAGASIP